MTVVGTGVLNRTVGNKRVNASRNCSSLSPTRLMSFSPALPSRKKFLVRTLTHVSFAATGTGRETVASKQRVTTRGTRKRFIILRSKNRGVCDAEAVFESCPLRHLLTRLDRRLELDLTSSKDSVLS